MTSEDIARDVERKITEVSTKRHFSRQFKSTPPGNHLFHYTTVAGLQGIVSDNCLHASAAYFLNDSSELEYGQRILDKVLDRWELDNPELRDDVASELVSDLRANIIFKDGHKTLIHSVYLACFCQRDNVLSQWRAYG